MSNDFAFLKNGKIQHLHFSLLLLCFRFFGLKAETQFTFSNGENGMSYSQANSNGIYKNGTFIIGGLFPIHFESKNSFNQSMLCSGRFNHRGYEEAQAMVYAIDKINNDSTILPGITLGADIKDTCMSVDYAVRESLNFSFISRTIKSDICGAVPLNKRVQKQPDTIAIIGPGVSDIAIAVTNLVGLFHVPVIDFSSTSRLLNNRVRFKYFFRTVSSDALLSKAIVDFISKLGWNIFHLLYSDTDYGRSAMETFEYVLEQTKSKICRASKGIFDIHSSKKHLRKLALNIKKEPRAKVIVLFTTIQDLELILNVFEEENMTDFTFISTDYYSGSIKQFKCSRDMLRRVIGIVPHMGESTDKMAHSFDKLLNDTFVNSKWYNEYQRIKRNLKRNSTMKFCHSLYVPYVVDAVYAVAHALHNLLGCSAYGCKLKPEQFPEINRDGEALLTSLHAVKFKGLSRDPVMFDEHGENIGMYDVTIVNPLTDNWIRFGQWQANNMDKYELINKTSLDLNMTILRNVWSVLYNDTGIPTAVCGKPCPPGHRMAVEDDHQVCCWQCVPCTRNYISHNPVRTSCQKCPLYYWPNKNHTVCQPIVPKSVTFKDPPGIVVAMVASLGSLTVIAVAMVFTWFGETHLVRSSSRLLSYIMLFGILLGYVTSLLMFVEKTEFLCRTVLFLFSVSFSIVVGTLLTKTNRIHRIFSKKAMRNGTPPCLSDNWMILFIAGFVSIEIIICIVIIATTSNGQLKEILYSELSDEAFLQCKFYATYSDYNMAIWWTYNTGIVLVCTYQAYLTRKVPGSYNEARFIAFTMMTISTDVVVFFLSYYGTRGYYKDVLVSMFLIIAVTVTLCCVFVPKVYVILLKPEKNTDHTPGQTMGFIEQSDNDMRKISHVSQRSCLSYLSNSSQTSAQGTSESAKFIVAEDLVTCERKRKMSVFVKNGLLESQGELSNGRSSGPVSMETVLNDDEPVDFSVSDDRRKVSRLWSGLSTRSVRFEDEIDEPSVILEEFDPSYLDDIEYKRRKSTI